MIKRIRRLRSQSAHELRKAKIAVLKASGEQIAVWGAGAFAMGLWSGAGLSGCNVMCFVDNNPCKQDTLFMGNKILPLSALTGFEGTFVICSMLYAEDIKDQIVSSGMKNKLVIL